MNQTWLLFHLREAAEELNGTIAEIEGDAANEFDEATLRAALAHVYHHLNFAWNSRNFTQTQTETVAVSDFETLRQFPVDVMLESGAEDAD